MKPKDSKRPIVVLEPELELIAATLSPTQRRELARVYRRWARQLFVSARVLEKYQQPSLPRLKRLSPSKLALN